MCDTFGSKCFLILGITQELCHVAAAEWNCGDKRSAARLTVALYVVQEVLNFASFSGILHMFELLLLLPRLLLLPLISSCLSK